MNKKIILPELIDLYSEKQGINKKDAELFVKSMLDLIVEALATEKYVKVKGLGTFKLTEVDSRESVNVNTGERIEIQGHTKVSFTPDTTMKELINKPFSHFETVVLNEGVELEGTPIEMSGTTDSEEAVLETNGIDEVTIIKDPQSEPVAEEATTEVQTVEPAKDEPTILEEASITEAVKEIEAPEETSVMEESQPKTIEIQKEQQEKNVTDSKEKNINRILWGIIVVLILIILFGAYWMFLRPSDTLEPVSIPPVQEETVISTPVIEEKQQEKIARTIQFIELSEEELRKERVPSFADTLDCQIVGTQEEYTLQKGETIIRASVRFFGTKKYWPYIVKHNMDVLKDPDNIPAGIRIKIPKLVEKK